VRAQLPLLPEREPNDTAATARTFDRPALIQGTLARGDVDTFALVIDDDASTQRFDVTFDGPAGAKVTVALAGGAAPSVTLTTSAERPSARAERLLLVPGRHVITVSGGEGAYVVELAGLRLRPVAIASGRERARADRLRATKDAAYLLPSGVGWLRFAPAAGPIDVDVGVMGDAKAEVVIEDARGAALASTAGGPIRGLALAGGDHWLRVTGTEGALVLIDARAAGAPGATVADVTPLVVGRAASGQLDAKRPASHRVVIDAAPAAYTLRASGPGVKLLAWTTPAGVTLMEARPTAQVATFDKLVMPPGEHFLSVSGTGAYRLELERAPLPASFGKAPSLEREPNDGGAFVDALRFGVARAGIVNGAADQDTYRLVVPGEVSVRWTITASAPLEVRWTSGATLTWRVPATGATPWIFQGRAPAGDHLVQVRGASPASLGGTYTIVVELDDAFTPTAGEAAGAPTAVAVEVKMLDDTTGAYASSAQTLRGEVTLIGGGAGEVALEARTSDPRWRATLATTRAELAKGKRVKVPFEVRVAAEALADRPVRIDVGARSAGAAWSSGHAFVVARVGATVVAPTRDLPLPEALLGGVDVARGGTILDATGAPARSGSRAATLLQGFARAGRVFEIDLARATKPEDMPTVALVRSARVVGVTLEALGPDLSDAPRDFVVSLSRDGKAWSEALVGALEAREGEQAFVLTTPIEAAFARLEIRSGHAGKRAVRLGAFKVIADPRAPIGDAAGVDLAAAERGGHVVRASPPEAAEAKMVGLVDRPLELVLGFHHARAARVAAIVWEDAPSGGGERPAGITLYASLDGPIGPWREVGTLAAPGRLALAADDAWVRFLKIVGATPARRGRFAVPVVRVIEAAPRVYLPGGPPGYRSILGEWGRFARASEFELARPASAVPPATARGNQRRESAERLGVEAVSGRVQRGRVEDWYEVTVPAGHNRLVLSASAHPTLDCDLELSEPSGALLAPAETREEASALERAWDVRPGARYHVRVWQPPSSVVFAWDTSGSVSGWVPLVRNAIQRFAETVIPGQEVVQLLPFGGGPLLIDWESGVEHLGSALARYTPSASSESERALRVAADMLAERRGARAVLVLTDALTPRDHDLWRALEVARPRVFAAGVAAGLEGVGQDRLQAWASASGGEYDGVSSEGQLDTFFERASTRLRAPASYTRRARAEAAVVLAPGTLEVVDDRPADVASRAVALVVDLSGSMLEAMKGGGTRIAVAKAILADTLDKSIPPGTKVAVRTFGRVGADACGTELAVPFGSAAAARVAIPGIDAKKWAMTPIAQALEAVTGDLASVGGEAIVVLLTDGR